MTCMDTLSYGAYIPAKWAKPAACVSQCLHNSGWYLVGNEEMNLMNIGALYFDHTLCRYLGRDDPIWYSQTTTYYFVAHGSEVATVCSLVFNMF